MSYNLIIIMKNQENINVSLRMNTTKAEALVLLNSQIIQNPNGTFELDLGEGNIMSLKIEDMSHIIIL